MRESAASACKRMVFMRKDAFKRNTTECDGYFKDGCSWPWCDSCWKNKLTPKEMHETVKKGD